MGALALETTRTVPRSKSYKGKELKQENFTRIKGTTYYKRVFTDGSVELTRYDFSTKRWVFLLFKE